MNLLFLLFLHHVADVWAQPGWLIENKKTHLFALHEHVSIYTGVLCLGFYFLGLFEPWMVAWFYGWHYLTDLITYRVIGDRWGYARIYPDQIAHYLQIGGALWLSGP